jgi:hypothetical protein
MLWRPIRLWVVEDPTLSRQSVHSWWWDCQPYTPSRALLPRNSFSASGAHFCYTLSKSQSLVRPEGLGKLKKKLLPSSITSTVKNSSAAKQYCFQNTRYEMTTTLVMVHETRLSEKVKLHNVEWHD